ncbi:MAG: hypothetical protein ABW133_16960 [Polyangiaceae bacterium]
MTDFAAPRQYESQAQSGRGDSRASGEGDDGKQGLWMTMSRAMLAMTLLVAACGGETLDIGREPTDGTGGATGDPSNDSGAPGGPTNSTVIVSPERTIRDLALYDEHLYWVALGSGDSTLERCRPTDCQNTTEVLGRLVSGYTFLGRDLYMIALDPGSSPQTSSLVSCPLHDCASPKKVATITKPSSVLVDDSGIYWSTNFDTSIYACPLAGCDAPARTVVDGFFSLGYLASDERHLYYLVETANGGPHDLASVLKDGSAPPVVIAKSLKNPTRIRVRDGFVYWSSVGPQGYVARCPLRGCVNAEPEILAGKQRYPLSVEPEGDSIFWLNENAGTLAGSTTPATIQSCKIASCANDVAVIDSAKGPASWLNLGSNSTTQLLVADADAIYYVGDQKGRDFDGGVPRFVDYAIRRLPRNR